MGCSSTRLPVGAPEQNPSQSPQPAPPELSQVPQKLMSRAALHAHEYGSVTHAPWPTSPQKSTQLPQSGHVPQKAGSLSAKHSHDSGSVSHALWPASPQKST